MPKHIARLLLVIVICAVAAYAGKQLLTVKSFYQYGHYRGDSVAEIASDKPKYATPKSCETCHTAIYAEWSKGVHYNPEQGKVVKCEVCHGASGSRDKNPDFPAHDNSATGTNHPKDLKMAIPADTVKLCTLCHEQMPGRPLEQKQIVVATHAGAQQCKVCHNVHSPRSFVGALASTSKPGNAAAGKAIADDCAACHGKLGISDDASVPSLAGQNQTYLADAIKAYKKGLRKDAMMNGMAKDLSDTASENLAAYYASLTCKSAQDGETKAAASGQALAQKCASCHGVNGISTQAMWPSLAGLSKGYLEKAMKSYKGERKNGMMNNIAKNLNEKDIAALAAYYANVACR
jgi:cytochrome c553